MFRERRPSIFITPHKMPRLPWDFHLVTTESSPRHCDSQKKTQHDTSEVLRLPRKMTMEVSKVLRLPRKMQRLFCKRRKSIAPATQNDFRHVCRHLRMSRSATPGMQNHITTCFGTMKQDRFCNFTHRHGEARRNQKNRDETCWSLKTSMSCETSVKWEPLLRIREK